MLKNKNKNPAEIKEEIQHSHVQIKLILRKKILFFFVFFPDFSELMLRSGLKG